VFKLETSGMETVLYSFTGGPDGGSPYGRLVRDGAGNLYGTTASGGDVICGCGTVFKLDPAGKETILYAFKGYPVDGATPWAGLVSDKAGNLYGTTSGGGAYGDGIVFNLGMTGVFVKPTNGWRDMTQTAKLNVPYGETDVSVITSTTRRSRNTTAENLGWSVSISGNSIVAGAPGHNDGTGAAYVFRKPASGWSTSSKFSARLAGKGGKEGDECGESVSIIGNTVLVGAYLATVAPNSKQGAAYLFDPELLNSGNDRPTLIY
jgi:uncharacterized repeat protein (TIGR03803 family)